MEFWINKPKTYLPFFQYATEEAFKRVFDENARVIDIQLLIENRAVYVAVQIELPITGRRVAFIKIDLLTEVFLMGLHCGANGVEKDFTIKNLEPYAEALKMKYEAEKEKRNE